MLFFDNAEQVRAALIREYVPAIHRFHGHLLILSTIVSSSKIHEQSASEGQQQQQVLKQRYLEMQRPSRGCG